MTDQTLALILFGLTYTSFLFWESARAYIACIGAMMMIFTGLVSPQLAFGGLVHWNVVALFFGTLILAELFMLSKMPAVIAEVCVDRMKNARSAILVICVLSSFISIFVENVAVVLLIAPVALSLCERLKLSPVKPLIFLAMFSNLQGTATLIGDPPSMILGGYLKMQFNDFFFYQGKMSIFFIIQVGAIAALIYTFLSIRKWTQSIKLIPVEDLLSWVPTAFLGLLIVILATASHFDPEFKWMAGTVAMSLAAVGLIWHRFGPRWTTTRSLIGQLDWDTTLFLTALFILVGTLRVTGIIDQMAFTIAETIGGSLVGAYLSIIIISVVISAFIDNVPYILTMIPVVQHVADTMGAPLPLLVFALLIGSCLGGNITPVGATANIVAVGMLRKQGTPVSFLEYVKLGLPFTLSAVGAASIVLWIIWS